ncbi:hypothetical protein V6259_13110 [Marinomonas sp. TI.3.20]|uniref:hypothetical protein n=1 Tax=Marinomonas sp. TI.3.20 TaxID=3121296 RepID=UPI00311E05B8
MKRNKTKSANKPPKEGQCPSCHGEDFSHYIGIYGYEAHVCKSCGSYSDTTHGQRDADEWSMRYASIGYYNYREANFIGA